MALNDTVFFKDGHGMKRGLSVAAGMAALTAAGLLAGCGEGGKAAEKNAPPPADTAVAGARPPVKLGVAPSAPGGEAARAADGAPSFAVIYPGGDPEGPATLAQSPTGPGGVLTFTTDATPEAVVAFYRQRAEAAGLKTINAMNQGGVLGYAAGDGADGRGQLLSVVANPIEAGPTSVQLSWSAGR